MENEDCENENADVIEEIQEAELEAPVIVEGETDDSSKAPSYTTYETVNESNTHLQAKGKYYKQTYRTAWEQMSDFKGWLRGVQGEPTRAYCTYCQKTLHAHRLSLLKHTCTIRHQKAAQLHKTRKNIPKVELTETNMSSSEDEGAKLNDKSDPEFNVKASKVKRSSTTSIPKVSRTRRSKRKASTKNTYATDSEENWSGEDESPKKRKPIPQKSKTFPKKKLTVKQDRPSSSAVDEVNEAITQLQSLSDSIQEKTEDEFDLFGKYIASQLRKLSTLKALRAQQRIHSFLSDLRLAEINEISSSSVNQAKPIALVTVAPASNVASVVGSISNMRAENNGESVVTLVDPAATDSQNSVITHISTEAVDSNNFKGEISHEIIEYDQVVVEH